MLSILEKDFSYTRIFTRWTMISRLQAYQLQGFGFDVFEANKALGFEDDERDYRVAAHMLMAINVHSVKLLTNNLVKIFDLQRHGILVSSRELLFVIPNKFNRKYLQSKYEKSCHMLKDLFSHEDKRISDKKIRKHTRQ
jgi:GTP cyclohydrolase II